MKKSLILNIILDIKKKIELAIYFRQRIYFIILLFAIGNYMLNALLPLCYMPSSIIIFSNIKCYITKSLSSRDDEISCLRPRLFYASILLTSKYLSFQIQYG